MEETKEKQKSVFSKILTALYFLVPVGIFIFLVSAPASMCSRITRCHWGLKGAKVIGDESHAMLLFHLYSQGRYKERSYNRLITVDLSNGAQLGEFITYDWMKPFGLTKKYLWVRQGGIKGKSWVAYALPGLERAKDLSEQLEGEKRVSKPIYITRLDPDGSDGLVIKASDEKWFTYDPDNGHLAERAEPKWDPWWNGALLLRYCEHPPKPPAEVGGELLLDGEFVCDNSKGRLLDLGDGSRLVAFQDLEKERGKLFLGRLGADGKWVWKFHEKDRFGARPRDEHGYRLAFAAMLAGDLVLILQQDDAVDDAWLVALDPSDGKQNWALHYD